MENGQRDGDNDDDDDPTDAVILEIGPELQRRRSSAVTTALPHHVIRLLPSRVAAVTWYFVLQLFWLLTLQFLPRRRAINGPKIPDIGGRSLKKLKLLAEGACAYVYEVKDVKSKQRFAVKEVKCWSEQDRRIALDEAKLMVKLSSLDQREPQPAKEEVSPFVICYGYSEVRAEESDVSHVYTLMELCSGSHLLDYLRRNGAMRDDAGVLELLMSVTRGLQLMHEAAGVSHWDLKLENILKSEGGSWKICDFGSASTSTVPNPGTLPRSAFLQLEETIAVRTTILYRPPEMVDLYRGHPIGPQADMWMLGCLLHAALLNRLPFEEASATAVLSGRLNIPQALCDEGQFFVSLIFWLLAPDPRDRPTADQLYREVLLPCCQTLSPNDRSWQQHMQSLIEERLPESVKKNRNAQTSRNATPPMPQRKRSAPIPV